jgi:ribose 5-phosphate isomerase B
MKIFIGADHKGFQFKQDLIDYLKRAGHEVVDEGDKNFNPDDDFPQFAGRVVSRLLADDDRNARGILLCGSGQGMCIAANRFKGIRAALGYDRESVRSSRNDDDSNVLCLPSSSLSSTQARELVDIWLGTHFAGAPRFVRRINELDNLN